LPYAVHSYDKTKICLIDNNPHLAPTLPSLPW